MFRVMYRDYRSAETIVAARMEIGNTMVSFYTKNGGLVAAVAIDAVASIKMELGT